MSALANLDEIPEPAPPHYAKITKSSPSYSVVVQSTPPMSGHMTAWELRDFVKALDAAVIPDDARILHDLNQDTRALAYLRVHHVFAAEQPAEPDVQP